MFRSGSGQYESSIVKVSCSDDEEEEVLAELDCVIIAVVGEEEDDDDVELTVEVVGDSDVEVDGL